MSFNPLAHTGKVIASSNRLGVAAFDDGDFDISAQGVVSLAAGGAVQTINGTANQITASRAGSTVTLSLPAAITAPGSLTTTTGLTAGSGFTVSAGAVAVTTGTAAINVSADAAATTINIGTGAGVKTTTLGSTNTTSATTIQAGSGGIALTGAVSGSATITAATGLVATTGGVTATAGDITATNGNVLINGAGKQLRVEGGAVTDFIGQATLALGTVTVLNTNIAAGDKVMVTRQGINGSTALGVFDVAITPATSFSITARNPTDATTQTNDVSIVDYFIVRQV